VDSELVPLPASGRVFAEEFRVGPADVSPADRARLDRIASWLQDVAYHDVVDGGVDGAGFWIVRRTRIRIEQFPAFTENLRLQTFCSGVSHALAERRTSIEGDKGAAIEAVSVWVNVDPETQMPARLPERFVEVYPPAGSRKPRSKLRHPTPPEDAATHPWLFREGNLDFAGHVNNTRYWAIADELLGGNEPGLPLDVEMEHRAAGPAGEAVVRTADDALWVTSPEGDVYASAVRL
jgi:acyl-ACP thioesterase